MATITATTTGSPSPFPTSPTKHTPRPLPSPNAHAHKPNPHPYAIKTTSTGVLSRSNSSGHTPHAKYAYVPASPSPSPTRSTSPWKERDRDAFRGHRYSRSLTHEPASPIGAHVPARPRTASTSSTSSADAPAADPKYVPKRAKTLPSPSPSPVSAHDTGSVTLQELDLPENPKLWTPAQLAAYLSTALRVRSGQKPRAQSGEEDEGVIASAVRPALPVPVARDIAAFVRSSGINGRSFLRLKDEDLEDMGVNSRWRSTLIAASRQLRRNLLRGRIWGFGSSPERSSNSADEDLDDEELDGAFALYASPASPDYTGTGSMRRVKVRRDETGRVRGMVETYERTRSRSGSGSVSSASGSEGGVDLEDLRRAANEEDEVMEREAEGLLKEIAQVDEARARAPKDEVPAEAESEAESQYGTALATDDEYPPELTSIPATKANHQAEPSIEALLEEEHASGRWGARAWEDMDMEGPGLTMKHVPDADTGPTHTKGNVSSDSGVGSSVAHSDDRGSLGKGERDSDRGRSANGSLRGRGSGKGLGRKDERRIVTAIFAPSASETEASPPNAAVPTETQDTAAPVEVQDRSASSQLSVTELTKARQDDVAFKALELELESTRSLLDAFRRRLEAIESNVSAMEARRAEADTPQRTARDGDGGSGGVHASSVGSGVVPFNVASVYARALSYVYPESRRRNGSMEPAHMRALPGYMLFVGMGVCAVVLKVVLRRMAGRHLRR